MYSTGDAKQKIEEIVNSLDAKERHYRKLAFVVGIVVSIVLNSISFLLGHFFGYFSSLGLLVFWLIVSLSLVWAIFVLAFQLVSSFFVEKRARALYLRTFATPEDHRTADSVLAEVGRSLLTLRRLRRKLGITIRRFRCSVCNSSVKAEYVGQIIQCRRCKTNLQVPVSPCCPECGNEKTRIITPDEQVPPAKGKVGGKIIGGCLYGPVGIIAGAIVDGINSAISSIIRSIRVAFKRHLYYCEKCKFKWGIKLPP